MWIWRIHEGNALESTKEAMALVLPYTSKDTKYDNANFWRRSTLRVNPNPSITPYCISIGHRGYSFLAILYLLFEFVD